MFLNSPDSGFASLRTHVFQFYRCSFFTCFFVNFTGNFFFSLSFANRFWLCTLSFMMCSADGFVLFYSPLDFRACRIASLLILSSRYPPSLTAQSLGASQVQITPSQGFPTHHDVFICVSFINRFSTKIFGSLF